MDEAQFFTGLKKFVEKVLDSGKTILLAGLDGDYKQRKFGELIDCVPLADKVFKISAMYGLYGWNTRPFYKTYRTK